MVDVTILTCKAYYDPQEISPYTQNILDEYQYLKEALEALGLTVTRTYWDNPNFNATQTRCVVFRTIWDYFERFDEFSIWLNQVKDQTLLINPFELIQWNIDKHYLGDLAKAGIAIVPTHFVDQGNHQTLASVCVQNGWDDVVIKPAISGAAFHTYQIKKEHITENEDRFKTLVLERDMLVQPFITTITERGEASLMVFDGRFTHAILKKAKTGDFRVQDDFGGSVHPYEATPKEIEFAEQVFSVCNLMPAYGRVDIVWDEDGNHLLSELEIIEPELWVRNHPLSAQDFAQGIIRFLKSLP